MTPLGQLRAKVEAMREEARYYGFSGSLDKIIKLIDDAIAETAGSVGNGQAPIPNHMTVVGSSQPPQCLIPHCNNKAALVFENEEKTFRTILCEDHLHYAIKNIKRYMALKLMSLKSPQNRGKG